MALGFGVGLRSTTGFSGGGIGLGTTACTKRTDITGSDKGTAVGETVRSASTSAKACKPSTAAINSERGPA
jgi:hypothetical protein